MSAANSSRSGLPISALPWKEFEESQNAIETVPTPAPAKCIRLPNGCSTNGREKMPNCWRKGQSDCQKSFPIGLALPPLRAGERVGERGCSWLRRAEGPSSPPSEGGEGVHRSCSGSSGRTRRPPFRKRLLATDFNLLTMRNWIAQIISVTSFNLRSIPERKGAVVAAAVGIAGVVAVFVGVLSIAAGFRAAMTVSGAKDVAVVLRSGADSEMTSGLSREEVRLIADAPGVARTAD